MNWLVFSVIGAAAAWFEYNYRRSKKHNDAAESSARSDGKLAVRDPSISPGSENEKKLNTTA
jgi:hypothetical protein